MADEVYEIDLDIEADADDAITDVRELDEGLGDVRRGSNEAGAGFARLGTAGFGAGILLGFLSGSLLDIARNNASVINLTNTLSGSLNQAFDRAVGEDVDNISASLLRLSDTLFRLDRQFGQGQSVLRGALEISALSWVFELDENLDNLNNFLRGFEEQQGQVSTGARPSVPGFDFDALDRVAGQAQERVQPIVPTATPSAVPTGPLAPISYPGGNVTVHLNGPVTDPARARQQVRDGVVEALQDPVTRQRALQGGNP